MSIEAHIIPVLADNYAYVLYDNVYDVCAIIDPGESEPVEEFLTEKKFVPDMILVTHYHGDHVGGVLELKEDYGCKVLGPGRYASRIPGLDMNVVEGDEIPFGATVLKVLHMPGHTLDHIVYWLESAHMLFAGDVLFGTGCGALFEGSPKRMWHNMLRIRDLPDQTKVYCGHEYTTNNIIFALSIDPDNAALQQRAIEVKNLREKGLPTVPLQLDVEKASNPFLRADDPLLMAKFDLKKPSPAACFASIRNEKDKFVPPKVTRKAPELKEQADDPEAEDEEREFY